MPEYAVDFVYPDEVISTDPSPIKKLKDEVHALSEVFIIGVYCKDKKGEWQAGGNTINPLENWGDKWDSHCNYINVNKQQYSNNGAHTDVYLVGVGMCLTTGEVYFKEEFHLSLVPDKPKKKIYVNGPKATKDFLAKKGGHYV
jgi:hypothetical protein